MGYILKSRKIKFGTNIEIMRIYHGLTGETQETIMRFGSFGDDFICAYIF